jgi:streptogramin lyase
VEAVIRACGAVLAIVVLLAGCEDEDDPGRVDPSAEVVELPGAGNDIDFDDIAYSGTLDRMVVPARDDGLYLVDPVSGEAEEVPLPDPLRSADSADEGGGSIFVADRETTSLAAIDPDGQLLARVETDSTPDYVRYLAERSEVWVSEPSAQGIEIFAVPDEKASALERTGFISVPGGPEGLTVAALFGDVRVYTHADSELVAIDAADHTMQRWPIDCDGTHGFPRVDTRDGLVLASCASDGRVVLVDAETGEEIDHYDLGGDESLPAWSDESGHFYVRTDPGTTVAVLEPSESGLSLVREVDVPAVGHCLGSDNRGHYWTCDGADGRLLRFEDQVS